MLHTSYSRHPKVYHIVLARRHSCLRKIIYRACLEISALPPTDSKSIIPAHICIGTCFADNTQMRQNERAQHTDRRE